MNVAEYLCHILETRGVEYIFGLFGDIQTEFAHAVRKSSLKWIGVYNEKTGGFMADIYARVSGKVGVIFTTLGPGATNLTTALANATQDRSPLIAISDQAPLKECRDGTHQYVNLAEIFHQKTGITKKTFIVKKVENLPSIISEAFLTAASEPKGSVHISIPADLFGQVIDKKLDVVVISNRFSKKNNQIISGKTVYKQLFKELNSIRKGLVIVGGSVERAGAIKKFQAFIEKYKLPVLTTFRGKNSIPSEHSQCLGTISRHLEDAIVEITNEVDYLILVGYDYNEGVMPSLWRGKKVIFNIDIYDNRIKNIFTPPTIIGNLNFLFADLVRKRIFADKANLKFEEVKQKVQRIVIGALSVKHEAMNPKRIIDAVNEVFGHNSIIICDVGLNKYYSGLLLKATKDNQVLFSNGFSSMAFSAGAMGAKIANPKRRVVALVGDGGFLMDMQEIIASIQYKMPVIWMIFNNGGLGLIEQAQLKTEPKHHGVKFSRVIFKDIAYALGAYGERIEPGENLVEILTRIKKINKTAVLDIPVEYTTYRS